MVPKTRLFYIASILVTVTTLIFICGATISRANSPVEIRFWHAMGRSRGRVLNELVDRFNRANPGIVVKAEYIQSENKRYGNDYNALYAKILENLAQNEPPDVAQVYENWTTQYVGIDAIVPVEEFMSAQDRASLNDLVPVLLKANTFPNNEGQQKIYTLPFNKSIFVLYYNKNIFRELGLKPPATWDELRHCAKAIAKKKGVPGLAFLPNVDIFGHYLYSYGGQYIANNKAAFGGKLGVDDLNYWVNLVHKDMSATPTFEASRLFANGKAGMYIESTSRIGGFDEARSSGLDFGVLPIPKGTTQASQMAGTNLAIFRGDNDIEKHNAAYKFILYMCSPEVTVHWATQTGYLPVRKSAINSPEYQAYVKRHPEYGVGLKSMDKATIQPRVPVWESIRSILDDTMFKALGRKCDSVTAIREASDTSDQLLYSVGGFSADNR